MIASRSWYALDVRPLVLEGGTGGSSLLPRDGKSRLVHAFIWDGIFAPQAMISFCQTNHPGGRAAGPHHDRATDYGEQIYDPTT